VGSTYLNIKVTHTHLSPRFLANQVTVLITLAVFDSLQIKTGNV